MLIHIRVLYLYKETAVLFNKIHLKPHSIPFSIVCIVDKVKSKLCVYNYKEYFYLFFFRVLYPIKNNLNKHLLNVVCCDEKHINGSFFKIISRLIAILCMYIVSRVLYYKSNFSFTWHTPGRSNSQTHNLSFPEIKSDTFCNNSWRRINTKYMS